MQYSMKSGHALANFALRCEGPEKLKEYAPMQYRYEIEHAPANFALQRY